MTLNQAQAVARALGIVIRPCSGGYYVTRTRDRRYAAVWCPTVREAFERGIDMVRPELD